MVTYKSNQLTMAIYDYSNLIIPVKRLVFVLPKLPTRFRVSSDKYGSLKSCDLYPLYVVVTSLLTAKSMNNSAIPVL